MLTEQHVRQREINLYYRLHSRIDDLLSSIDDKELIALANEEAAATQRFKARFIQRHGAAGWAEYERYNAKRGHL